MKREDALDCHSTGRPGKIAVVPTKPLNNQRDLGLAYSPSVALPCLVAWRHPGFSAHVGEPISADDEGRQIEAP